MSEANETLGQGFDNRSVAESDEHMLLAFSERSS